MNEMQLLYRYVDDHQDKFLQELFPLLRKKSISYTATKDEMTDCAQLLLEILEKYDFKAKIFSSPGFPYVYGERIYDKDAPTVLIYGHYDVMPVEPVEAWKTEPFEPTIINGKIFCRGASDDKGQSMTYLLGYVTYETLFGHVPVNVKFIFDGEEEIGSPNLPNFVAEHVELLKADFLLSSDSKIHESGRPVLFLGLKGMCSVDLTVRGGSKDLHSMYAPVAPSPVWRLVTLLSSLKGEDGIVKLDHFYDDVAALTELDYNAISKIPFDADTVKKNLDVSYFVKNRTGENYYYNYIYEPTCNIGFINAGYANGVKDVIPHEATARLDLNLVPNQKPEKVLQLLRQHLDRRGYSDVEITPCSMMTPYRSPLDSDCLPLLCDAVREVWEQEPVILPGIGGFGPNVSFCDYLGIPNIYIPYGALDNSNHAPNESLVVEGYLKGIKVFATILDKLARQSVKRHK